MDRVLVSKNQLTAEIIGGLHMVTGCQGSLRTIAPHVLA